MKDAMKDGRSTRVSGAALRGLLEADWLRLRRDRFLLSMGALMTGICLVLRWAVPWITHELEARWGFDLTAYYSLLTGHLVLVLPTVTVGILGGFILLESREERVAAALATSPLPFGIYLALVGTVMVACCVALVGVHALLLALPLPSVSALAAMALAAASVAPAKAFFVAAAADDKVEAMAYTKVVSAAAPIALVAYFLPEPWQWLAGIYPPYFAAKAFWLAMDGAPSWPGWLLGAFAVSALWTRFFGRRLVRSARR